MKTLTHQKRMFFVKAASDLFLVAHRPGLDPVSQSFQNAFLFWQEKWSRIMRHLKQPFDPSDLTRKDWVLSAQTADGEVAALLAFRVHQVRDLDTSSDPLLKVVGATKEYFEFQADGLQPLTGQRTLVTFECNTLSSAFSQRKIGLPLVEAMVYLGGLMCQDLRCDWCVGVSRQLTGVQETGLALGFQSFPNPLLLFGCPVQVQAAPASQVRSMNLQVLSLADQLLSHPLARTWRLVYENTHRKAA